MDSYVKMAYAIIELAAQDYRAAKSHQIIDTKNAMPGCKTGAQLVAEDCEQFFLSKWFSVLSMSDVDGYYVLRLLDEDVRRGWKKPGGRRNKDSFL